MELVGAVEGLLCIEQVGFGLAEGLLSGRQGALLDLPEAGLRGGERAFRLVDHRAEILVVEQDQQFAFPDGLPFLDGHAGDHSGQLGPYVDAIPGFDMSHGDHRLDDVTTCCRFDRDHGTEQQGRAESRQQGDQPNTGQEPPSPNPQGAESGFGRHIDHVL